ncbi:MAG: aquaporin [Thaumarchaeota archaeon]|nr:aquaporin [Nitrososphaerota archaeon]
MDAPLSRRVSAEFAGTLIFVLVGAGSAIGAAASGASDPGLSLLAAALGNGLGLAMAVSATMGVSGGVLNPAVAIGLAAGGKIKASHVLSYIGAELLGATLAGGALVLVIPSSLGNAANWGAPTLSSSLSIMQGVGVEALLTFVLVMAVFGTAVDSRAPKIGGLGIGLAVLADVLVGGPLTGAAMNPARAMGPMIASLSIPSYWYIYWIGPVLGATIAGLVYGRLIETAA